MHLRGKKQAHSAAPFPIGNPWRVFWVPGWERRRKLGSLRVGMWALHSEMGTKNFGARMDPNCSRSALQRVGKKIIWQVAVLSFLQSFLTICTWGSYGSMLGIVSNRLAPLEMCCQGASEVRIQFVDPVSKMGSVAYYVGEQFLFLTE